MPLVIVFPSEAENEEKYKIRAGWIVGMPSVEGKFGHETTHKFPAIAIVNKKGGTDSRVLFEVLKEYIDALFPSAADESGRRVLFKIDGGPGRLNVEMLAELRCKGVYLFPGVQNKMHVTQETDQNYGLFKSGLRKNIKKLTGWVLAQYKKEVALHESDPALHPYPKILPHLTKEDYPRLVGGSDVEPKLLPAFQNAFSKEQNLRACEENKCVPNRILYVSLNSNLVIIIFLFNLCII
mmetsp:Transcript_23022/g.32975  ORF Transcript_23022/g.32975 Transcript_23022/m.32975 type:complete len:238 (-) Transcript_23022:368-1081(-)